MRAGGELRLYLDGRLVATAPAGPAVVSIGALAVGRAKFGGQNTDFWRGGIDEVSVAGRALTDAEIAGR